MNFKNLTKKRCSRATIMALFFVLLGITKNQAQFFNGPVISTYAGNGTNTYNGSATIAKKTGLNNPIGLYLDASGNLLIADDSNHAVRKVTPSGAISTIAGNGSVVFPYVPDGSLATATTFYHPSAVVADPAGNIYISDVAANIVRVIKKTDGKVYTIAGTPSNNGGFSGDNGLGSTAQLNFPVSLAIDSAGLNLYIADYFNHRIRKVSLFTGVITTVAGSSKGFGGDGGAATSAKLNSPTGVAIDKWNNLYIADYYNRRIRKVDGSTGIITTVAGNGNYGFSQDGVSATATSLAYPREIDVDAYGNLYISTANAYFYDWGNVTENFNNERIRKVNRSGIISTIIGSGTAGYFGDDGLPTDAGINGAFGIVISPIGGDIFFADANSNVIRKVTQLPVITSFTPTTAVVGTTVTIKGNYLSSASAVTFGSIVASSFTVLNDSTITATVGAGASGDISVNTPSGSGSASGFTFCTPVTPNITISTSATTVCSGSTVVFTATPTNGGSSPTYQWKVNGVLVGTGTTFSSNSLQNNDVVTCVLTSNASCATSTTATSNAITISVVSIWNGSTNSSWSTGSNWCNNTVPASGANVLIPVNGGGNYPILGANTAVGDLTINVGATLNINGKTLTINGAATGSGYLKGSAASSLVVNSTATATLYFNPSGTDSLLNSLTISGTGGAQLGNGVGITNLLTLSAGNLNLNGNRLTLKSTSITNTAVVGTVGGSASITGNVTVERYIPKGYKAYRELGAGGVYNAGSFFKNWQESGAKPAGYGTFIIGNKSTTAGYNSTTGLDNTTNGNSGLFTFKSATWDFVTNTKTTNIDPCAGYHLAVFGDRNGNLYQAKFDSTNLMTSATTLRTTGQLVTGTVTYSTTGVTGAGNVSNVKLESGASAASFIANPFACAIDWNALSKTGLSTSYYYFDPTFLTNSSYQVFVSYNSVSGNSNPGSSKMNQYIQPGQAFMVLNTSAASARQLVITEANKVTNQTLTAVFGAAKPLNRLAISLWKDIATVGNTNIDGAVAVFDNRFTKNIADEDAVKMNNPNENLAIVHTATAADLSIDGLPMPKAGDVLPLKLSQLQANTTYQLHIDASAFTAEGLEARLHDALLNTDKVISNETNVFEFTTNAATATNSNRFSISFSKPMASEIVASESKLVAYPNPVVNNNLTIQLSKVAAGKYSLYLYNQLGKTLMVKEIQHAGGTSSYQLRLPSSIGKGVYQLKAGNGQATDIKPISIVIE